MSEKQSVWVLLGLKRPKMATHEEIAAESLRQARLMLLDHQEKLEYEKAMVEMLQDRIARLTPVEVPQRVPVQLAAHSG